MNEEVQGDEKCVPADFAAATTGLTWKSTGPFGREAEAATLELRWLGGWEHYNVPLFNEKYTGRLSTSARSPSPKKAGKGRRRWPARQPANAGSGSPRTPTSRASNLPARGWDSSSSSLCSKRAVVT